MTPKLVYQQRNLTFTIIFRCTTEATMKVAKSGFKFAQFIYNRCPVEFFRGIINRRRTWNP